MKNTRDFFEYFINLHFLFTNYLGTDEEPHEYLQQYLVKWGPPFDKIAHIYAQNTTSDIEDDDIS